MVELIYVPVPSLPCYSLNETRDVQFLTWVRHLTYISKREPVTVEKN